MIYLDYNASTPVAPEVADVMRPLLEEAHGNPSSQHWAGAPAKAALEKARVQVATLLGCDTTEVVFTSGGSEANNLALKGVYYAGDNPHANIVTSAVEHPAILEPCRFLERLGARLSVVGVDHNGRVDPSEVEAAITDQTVLVSIMLANNETGTLQPISEVSEITRSRGVLLHTDAAQAVGKIPTRVNELGVDLLSVAGHKLYAPKGIGALFVRRGITLEPLIHGAGHESGRRAGTESALLAAGLGAACELAQSWLDMPACRALRDDFWRRLKTQFGRRVVRNGHPEHCLPNTLNVSFVGQIGEDILARLDGVAASTGSACHSGQVVLSDVLEAMGVGRDVGMGTIRFSLGRDTTVEEIDQVVGLLAAALD